MKKIFKIFIVLSLFLLTRVNVSAQNTSYIENMYSPGGANLICYDDLIEEERVLSMEYPIYVNKSNFNFTVQIMKDILDSSNPDVDVIAYDKNFNIIETKNMNLSLEVNVDLENGTTKYNYNTFQFNYQVYALRISNISISNSIEEYGIEVLFASYSSNPLTEYIPFVEKSVFISLLNNHPSIYASYDNELSEEDISDYLVAEDVYRGMLSEEISIDISKYTPYSNRLGQYQVDLSVSDGYNTFETYIYIKVLDKVPPVIMGRDSIEFGVEDFITEEMILDEYEAIDAYDGDVTNTLFISSEYVNEPINISSQEVELTACDLSGNYSTRTITIKSVDNLPPTITGDTTIYIGYDLDITKEELIERYFVIKDNVDKNPTVTFINDTYTENNTKVGTWSFIIKATDDSGNIKEKAITIVIADNIPPVIYIDSYQIELSGNVALTEEDFAELLFESGELTKNKKYKANVVQDTYHGNESVSGTYAYQVIYSSEDGEKIEKTFKIIVNSEEYTVSKNSLDLEQILIISLSFVSITMVFTIVIMKIKSKKKITQ